MVYQERRAPWYLKLTLKGVALGAARLFSSVYFIIQFLLACRFWSRRRPGCVTSASSISSSLAGNRGKQIGQVFPSMETT
mmetsp:Transcript_80461/g.127032  ORF Transcript_80461/g.127032 Transcript_80461/m.127032 type:complete len:80 (+) Transcript_80461:2-241(+)